jgi:hypothetical protein
LVLGQKNPTPTPQEVAHLQRKHYPEKVNRAAEALSLKTWSGGFVPCTRGSGVAAECQCMDTWRKLARVDSSDATTLSAKLKNLREKEIRQLESSK